MDLLIKNGTVVTDSEMFVANIAVNNGKITAIAEDLTPEADTAVVDAAG